jgi:hypothetical protein
MNKLATLALAVGVSCGALASGVSVAHASSTFTLAVYGRGNPAVKLEVSADGYRVTRELGAEGRTSFAIPGPQKVIYYWIEGCGTKRGGQYNVNGTVAARLDIDAHCAGTVASNQDNLR